MQPPDMKEVTIAASSLLEELQSVLGNPRINAPPRPGASGTINGNINDTAKLGSANASLMLLVPALCRILGVKH
eukprot:9166349-Alexandrium_andersonii.AAC.1